MNHVEVVQQNDTEVTPGDRSLRIQKALVGIIAFIFFLPLLHMVVLRPASPYWRSLRYVDVNLRGMESGEEMPRPHLAAVASGSFQSEFQNWFGQNLGMRGRLVRLNNQIDYDLWNKSRMRNANMVIGQDEWLYASDYVDDWRGLNQPLTDAAAGQLVAQLVEFQRVLSERGQAFKLVISPNKASIYPEHLPARLARPEGVVRNYDRLLPLLQRSGLEFLDGPALIRLAKETYAPVPVFCRGGLHWNHLGAFVAARDILDGIVLPDGRAVPHLRLDALPVDQKPRGTDTDYANLLNLIWAPLDYDTPHPEVSVVNRAEVAPLHLVTVGGSFVFQLMDAWKATDCFDSLYFLYYYRSQIDYLEDKWHRPLIEEQPMDWERQILAADIIVIELNENALTFDFPGLFMRDYLAVIEGANR